MLAYPVLMSSMRRLFLPRWVLRFMFFVVGVCVLVSHMGMFYFGWTRFKKMRSVMREVKTLDSECVRRRGRGSYHELLRTFDGSEHRVTISNLIIIIIIFIREPKGTCLDQPPWHRIQRSSSSQQHFNVHGHRHLKI
jgi:hypothetical protein